MKVWVTRDEKSDGPLSSALRAVGLEIVHEPVLDRRILTDAADAISQLTRDDWLVLTSVYAVQAVAGDAARVPRVAVVGEASKRAALARGFRVERISPDGTGLGLFQELHTIAQRQTVCYPRSSQAVVPRPWPGAKLLSPVLYETVPRPFDRAVTHRVDVVCVVSPSAVEAIGRIELPVASIGPTTSAAIRKLGKEPWVEAPQPSFAALAKVIAERGKRLTG